MIKQYDSSLELFFISSIYSGTSSNLNLDHWMFIIGIETLLLNNKLIKLTN